MLFSLSMDSRESNQIKNQKRETDPILSLPREVALEIISRLPITSVLLFRSVCKSWKNLTYDHELVHLHQHRAENDDPCLIFHCDYPMRNWIYFVHVSDHEDEQVVRRIDPPFSTSMAEFKVVGSCNGLLCLTDSLLESSTVIYNPFTRDYRELPKSMEFRCPERRVVFGFGFHPVTKQYKVIKIVYCASEPRYSGPSNRIFTRSRSYVQILNLESGEWRTIGEAPYWLEFRSTGVLVNGNLHWLRRNAKYHLDSTIVSFDLAKEQFGDIPKPYFGEITSLAVLKGCLSGVTFGDKCINIWVMKEYGVKESWVKQFTIKSLQIPGFALPRKLWADFFCSPKVRVVCILNNGEVLIELKCVGLVAYDPQSCVLRHLKFHRLPNVFMTFVHLGCLNWINAATS